MTHQAINGPPTLIKKTLSLDSPRHKRATYSRTKESNKNNPGPITVNPSFTNKVNLQILTQKKKTIFFLGFSIQRSLFLEKNKKFKENAGQF